MKTGPYQHCPACNKETAHKWTGDLTYSCNTCGKETKVVQSAKKRIEAVHKALPRLTEGKIMKLVEEAAGDPKDWPVKIDGNGNIHFKGEGYHIVGGPGATAEFDKAMKESVTSFVEKQVPAMIEHNIKQYLEETKSAASSGWGSKLRSND